MTVEVIENFLPDDVFESIRNQVVNLHEAYFVDRSKVLPNYGLDGSISKYLASGADNLPKSLYKELYNAFDKSDLKEHSNLDILVNRYVEGMYIPKHRDRQQSNWVSVLTLDDKNTVFRYQDGNEMIAIPDKRNALITISIDVIHEVLPVEHLRHTIICNWEN